MTIETVLDPVCGMAVDPGRARGAGLTVEVDGIEYAFCRDGCRRAFLAEPMAFTGRGSSLPAAATATEITARVVPVIDAGMRLWYESCSCCLSDAHPEVKAALDAERASHHDAPVAAGICEVVEGSPAEAVSAGR